MLRVPIVIILFICLWGINLWLFEKLRFPYQTILSIKAANLAFVFSTALISGLLYLFCITALSNVIGLTTESGITLFYVSVLLPLFLPGVPGMDNRNTFFRLAKQCFVPGNTITFPEILLADAFTSISKILKDFGVSIFSIYAYYTGTQIIQHHNNAMITVALLASLPFYLRVRQCWVQLDSCSDFVAKIPVTLNIVKYMSAFPPIWITAAASLGYSHPRLPALLALVATINSTYSFLWDVVQDWGLIQVKRDMRLYTRPRLYLPVPVYAIAVFLNLFLRFSWSITSIPYFSGYHSSVIVLIIEVGEICRRSMWNVLRVEWEVIVQQERSLEQKDKLVDSGSMEHLL
jgi:hypothetical protein